MRRILVLFILLPIWAMAQDLMQDLMVVDYWNRKIYERVPVSYNFLLQGGYFNMPSARMGSEGEMGVGYAWVNPYIHYNLRVQMTKWLEVSGDYRIYKGVDDPILTPHGFGDLSDKGANLKFAPLTPEDSNYELPGIAIGIEDFIGTKSFYARYIVLTQVFKNLNAEVTLGYGQGRIKGFFWGIAWMPLRQTELAALKNITIAAEFDAIPYKDEEIEKHPKARKQKSPINFGVKWRFWDHLDFSLSLIRGNRLAFSVSGFYNFGDCKGFLPKIDDALPYAGIPTQLPAEKLANELVKPFYEQGFDLLRIYLCYDDALNKIVRLHIVNNNYRVEAIVRERLNHLLAGLIPDDVYAVVVTVEGDAFPIQEYFYRMDYLRSYKEGNICLAELNLLNPLREVTCLSPNCQELFSQRRNLWNLEVFPKTAAFFGSSRGKLKYALGMHVGLNGFLFDQIYYSALFGQNFISNLEGISGIDRLNPSRLINVRTDIIKYLRQKGITVDEGYLQKNWNLGRGWFGKIAGGLFEQEYGGLAAEFLYYPLKSNWAVGCEGAYLRKRTYTGVGFTNKARKLVDHHIRHVRFYPKQYFLNYYYNWCDAALTLKLKFGKFLADDVGLRVELMRYFQSGLRLSIWYTCTDGHDTINGHTYHDKGVAFSMPLDIFYTHSERDRWGNAMSAWLRDVGAISATGKGLYDMISEERAY